MDAFALLNGQTKQSIWKLSNLMLTPEEEWDQLQQFLNLNEADFAAMLATVEPLFQRGHELVVGTYAYWRIMTRPLSWVGKKGPIHNIWPSAAVFSLSGWPAHWAWT